MTHDPFVLSHKLEDDQSGGHVWGQYSQTNHSMNIPMRQEPLDVAFVEVRRQRHWDISVPASIDPGRTYYLGPSFQEREPTPSMKSTF